MEILAHRGYWSKDAAGNSPEALREALRRGYGMESDVRDFDGRLVISHNAAGRCSPPLSDTLRLLAAYQNKRCFAVNIKADGLGAMLKDALEQEHVENYFTFDMSVPQMVEYRDRGLIYFTRQSDVEERPVLYEDAAGVWLDSFHDDGFIDGALLSAHIAHGKKVCVVSPELHQKAHLPLWRRLRDSRADETKIMLCTDRPDEAAAFFGVRACEV